ncbi:MAG: YraN family protein, partial [Alphaproteobacteria bacterium]
MKRRCGARRERSPPSSMSARRSRARSPWLCHRLVMQRRPHLKISTRPCSKPRSPCRPARPRPTLPIVSVSPRGISMPVSSPSKTRQRNERRGRWAESLAAASLRLKGYRLLARRFKSGPGEVDLIMRRGEVTAFIEVKVRSDADRAVEAVTDFQARRIAAAARL